MSTSRDLAERTFDDLWQGIGSGRWDSFFAALADDVEMWIPAGAQTAPIRGKEAVMDFFSTHVRAIFPAGLRLVEVIQRTIGANSAVFEARVEGQRADGIPYRNRVAITLDFRAGKLASYREYAGTDRTAN